jgi:hypothetical protein
MSSTLPLLSPQVVAQTDALRARFAAAEPFRHVVIDDFFGTPYAQTLLAAFPSFETGNSKGEDGTPGDKSTLERIKRLGPGYVALDALIQSTPFLEWLGAITDIPGLLYDPAYFGGGTHENRHQATLDPHIDFNYHPSERWHRRINLIVYLNPDWRESWGGSLELFRNPYNDVRPDVSVVPLFNRCVVFETTEHSWHAFNTIFLPEAFRERTRKSIALYFYSKHRPPEQTAGKHTTHYVKRQLPERYVAGHTLEASDVAELHAIMQHRDTYILRLQQEIARLLQAQEHGLAGKLFYLAKRLYVRSRR